MISNETRRHYRVLLSNLDPNTQKYRVMKHLLENGSIRQDIAWEEYGFSRLGDIIYKLHNIGVDFETEWLIDEKTKRPMNFMTYSLADSFPDENEIEERKKNAKNIKSNPERQRLLKELREISKKLSVGSLKEIKVKADWLASREQEKDEQLRLF